MYLILFLIVSILIIIISRGNKTYRDVEKMFPGPIDWPVFGNCLILLGMDKSAAYKLLDVFSMKYPKAFRVRFGPQLYIGVKRPEEAEVLLNSSDAIQKADLYKYLWPWVGEGLLTSTGEKYKKRRKLLSAGFHYAHLEKFLEVFQKNDAILCSKLQLLRQESDVVDVFPCMKLYALDNICETAMDTEIHAQDNPQCDYVKAVHIESDAVFQRLYKFWLRPDFIFNKSKIGKISKEARRIIHELSQAVITKRREELLKRKMIGKSIEGEEGGFKGKTCLLDILLQAAEENGLTDEDIREEVDTFILGGHDTISSALSFALYEIARNPSIQDRIEEELKFIFGNDKRPATLADLKEMRYIEQVIKETMRLYPSLPVIGRKVFKDFDLGDGTYIPKGTEIGILIAAIHKLPEFWDNPDVFDPENFAPEAVLKRHPFAFLPFSAGLRTCVGQKFAMLEMKSALSSVLRNFKLSESGRPEDVVIIQCDLVLVPKDGVRIRMKLK